MSGEQNRGVVAELDDLVMQSVLTPEQGRAIAERYPTAPWDILVMARWFTILGAVAASVGLVMVIKEYVNAMRLGEAGLALATVAFVFLGRYLARTKMLVKTGAALEMAGGFALQGLTVVLAIDFSRGSQNWPALVGVQSLLLAALAYLLQNRLILIHSAACFFVFFGGETGYMSGWGAYWLAMTYPVRFLVAGLMFLAVAWLHATKLRGPLQAFSRVYAHLGLLVVHLALWFLSVFGYFEKEPTWTNNASQRLLFSLLWGLVSVGCLWLAGAIGQGIFKSYGITFLVIDVYTFYFQFVAYKTADAWWLHLLLMGGSLMWVGFAMEKYLRRESKT